MDELELLRQKKLRELQNNYNQALQEQAKFQQQVELLESVVKPYLDRNALSRYGNLKTAHYEKAVQVISLIAQFIQRGEIKEQISDIQFKDILIKLEPNQKFEIKRK